MSENSNIINLPDRRKSDKNSSDSKKQDQAYKNKKHISAASRKRKHLSRQRNGKLIKTAGTKSALAIPEQDAGSLSITASAEESIYNSVSHSFSGGVIQSGIRPASKGMKPKAAVQNNSKDKNNEKIAEKNDEGDRRRRKAVTAKPDPLYEAKEFSADESLDTGPALTYGTQERKKEENKNRNFDPGQYTAMAFLVVLPIIAFAAMFYLVEYRTGNITEYRDLSAAEPAAGGGPYQLQRRGDAFDNVLSPQQGNGISISTRKSLVSHDAVQKGEQEVNSEESDLLNILRK